MHYHNWLHVRLADDMFCQISIVSKGSRRVQRVQLEVQLELQRRQGVRRGLGTALSDRTCPASRSHRRKIRRRSASSPWETARTRRPELQRRITAACGVQVIIRNKLT